MATIKICDRCNKRLELPDTVNYYCVDMQWDGKAPPKDVTEFDLCAHCGERLKNWVREGVDNVAKANI